MSQYAQFECDARNALEKHLKVKLYSGKVSIKGKEKSFDILNKDKRIVGDVKNYKTTSGRNRPSAKFSILNEYCWIMKMIENDSSEKWMKLFVIGEDREMLLQYVKEFDAWLDDIEVYYYSYKGGIEKIR